MAQAVGQRLAVTWSLENRQKSATREAKEETDVDVAAVKFRAITNDVFEAEGKHHITLWMEGVYAAGEPIVNAAHETTGVG